MRTKNAKKIVSWILAAVLSCGYAVPAFASERTDAPEDILRQYTAYEARFGAIERVEDIEENNYRIFRDQIFPFFAESFGTGEYTLIPALERTYGRLALFMADEDGDILYKCNQLEANNCVRGELSQPVQDMASVAFADVNRDGRTDIILIAKCVNDSGSYAGVPYKVGDVLFQGDGTFYRDWRVSDKINRFDMNKSANFIISFVRDGKSAEILYTASRLDELLESGFEIAAEQCYTREFEKLGKLRVVPGVLRISEYNIFMVYLVNGQGDIVWSLQPMKDYDSLYSLRGINGRDLDGDGMKDLVVLAWYSMEGEDGELLVEPDCSVYYQRTRGFEMDTEFGKHNQCTVEDTMEELVRRIRAYWGWKTEE